MAKTETVNIELYKGDVNITFYPNSHRYKINGESVKSVTKILSVINKPQLIPWAVGLAKNFLKLSLIEGTLITDSIIDEACSLYTKTRDDAADTWKMIHAWVEEFVKNKIEGWDQIFAIPDNEKVQNGIMGFLSWYKSHKIDFTFSEKLVYSKKNQYVGTSDLGIVVDWIRLLADVKSSKAIYAEAILQEIAYLEAYEEENGIIFDWVITLRFDKETGSFETFTLLKTDPLYKAAHQAFVWALHLQKTLEEVESLLKNKND